MTASDAGAPRGSDEHDSIAPSVLALVDEAGRAARRGHASLAAASPDAVADALRGIAERLVERAPAVLRANAADLAAGAALGEALLDRLSLDRTRLERMAEQVLRLVELPDIDRRGPARPLPDGLQVSEVLRPVGVIGANYEARPNVTIDVASQLLKSRNAGVLRTGAAALGSAVALMGEVVGPAMAAAGVDPDAIRLVRSPARDAARALVSLPRLIPLVIIRGSGATTASLAREAAGNGVRTLAHADGGGVLYVDPSADLDRTLDLVERGLDRLGVCNRLNLLLVATAAAPRVLGPMTELLERLGITVSHAPHAHRLGLEWALESGREATVTVAEVSDAREAARIANEETSGIAATIVAEDAGAADAFLTAYAGTGAFWNASTRLLDGYALLGAPETGINVEPAPGPRGPVTYRDLVMRQYLVTPRAGGNRSGG